jgi:enoyl-CoA hydratase/carnithine racemase
MNRPPVDVRSAGGVVTVTLDRAEVRNTLTGEDMLDALLTAVRDSERDPEVAVLVITGAGSAFSAGGDVRAMASRKGLFAGTADEMAEAYRRTIQQMTRTMLTTDLVTIAGVNGPAVGAGFDLALACDLRIGSTRAAFAHTFVDLGIIPGDGGAWLLPRVVGWQRAAELSFTGRTVEAGEALAMGVLLEVVDPEMLTGRVAALAAEIAAKPHHSLRLAKRLLRHARSTDLDEFLDLSAAFQAIAHHTPEHLLAVERYLAAWEERRR